MKKPPSIHDRCKIFLKQWRYDLKLNNHEKSQLFNELDDLDSQIKRLNNQHFRLAAFGKVGVGKSSLLNALIGKEVFETDVSHGSTKKSKTHIWEKKFGNIKTIELIDTPGFDEIHGGCKTNIAEKVALQSDLILLVLNSDITKTELKKLNNLISNKKPVLIVLNQCDQWSLKEQKELIQSIERKLPSNSSDLHILLVAASPRKASLKSDGKVRSYKISPLIKPLNTSLERVLSTQGELFLSLNSLYQADQFYKALKINKLERNKTLAQSVIGKFATLKASGVAINPICLLDLAGGIAFDTALVVRLSQVYDLKMGGKGARNILKKLSIYNTMLGGAQLSIQLALTLFRHTLLLATPLTGGMSIITSAPIALVQVALAVHTTKMTGRLAAKELLRTNPSKEYQPTALLKRLLKNDPEVKKFFGEMSHLANGTSRNLKAVLP